LLLQLSARVRYDVGHDMRNETQRPKHTVTRLHKTQVEWQITRLCLPSNC
jgi:hypothetical protein